MNSMKIIFAGTLIFFSATISYSRDALAGVRCVNSSFPTCVVPIYSLYGIGAEEYEKFIIVTYGFMTKDGDDYVITPDKDASSFALAHQSIRLVFDKDEYKEIIPIVNNKYVRVVGKIRFVNESIFWADLILMSKPALAIRLDPIPYS